jgi:hypothetical protein
MKTYDTTSRLLLSAFLALLIVGAATPTRVFAQKRAHGQIWITITNFLGYDPATETTEIEARDKSAIPHHYHIWLYGYLSAIKQAVGQTGAARISVEGENKMDPENWTHLAIEGHPGELRIHRVR